MENIRDLLPPTLFALLMILSLSLLGHPTGNIAIFGGEAYWPYVHPIDDRDHHACVMKYDRSGEISVFFKSDYAASDFMMYADSEILYLLERRFIQSSDKFEFRIMRYKEGGQVELWWDWHVDEWRVGEGGFAVESENSILFARYPKMYRMKQDYSVEDFLSIEVKVSSMRPIPTLGFLLKTEKGCSLINKNGETIREWKDLIQNEVNDAPLGRNVIFDADYCEDDLVYAYWGGRSFEKIDSKGERSLLLRVKKPFAPHWVAAYKGGYLLFSSSIEGGRNPRPHLVFLDAEGGEQVLWEK